MNTIKTATVDGKEIPMLCADLNQAQELAIVSKRVLKALTALLPKAPFYEVRSEFMEKVRNTDNIEEFTNLLTDELDFHLSVNVVKEYFRDAIPEPVAVAVAAPRAK